MGEREVKTQDFKTQEEEVAVSLAVGIFGN
jgi:hypothetical protein